MELGPQNHNGDSLLVPNSILVVYMDPLGFQGTLVPDSGLTTSPQLQRLARLSATVAEVARKANSTSQTLNLEL